MKTNNPLKYAVSALLIGAAVLVSVTGVHSQSAAEIQNAIGILTDPSKSPQERINAARNLGVLGQDSDSAAQALKSAAANDPDSVVRQLAQTVAKRFSSN